MFYVFCFKFKKKRSRLEKHLCSLRGNWNFFSYDARAMAEIFFFSERKKLFFTYIQAQRSVKFASLKKIRCSPQFNEIFSLRNLLYFRKVYIKIISSIFVMFKSEVTVRNKFLADWSGTDTFFISKSILQRFS